jgi:hypothetical protein
LKEQSERFNKGKLRWALVDFESLEPMVEVLEFGAQKYAPDNWKLGLNQEEILESMIRHLTELLAQVKKKQPGLDSDSGLKHMGHIQCNAMFYNYHERNGSFSPVRNNPFKKS